VPIYDVRCRACGHTFEINRPMARANDPAPCPAGHDDTVRLLPTVAVTGRSGSGSGSAPAPRPATTGGGGGGGGGGCCGGGCCG
jgi:putative FmdB family regulatory protein